MVGVFAQMCVATFVAWRPRSEPLWATSGVARATMMVAVPPAQGGIQILGIFGVVTNWNDMEKILHHTFYNELRVANEENPVLYTDVAWSTECSASTQTQLGISELEHFWRGPQDAEISIISLPENARDKGGDDSFVLLDTPRGKAGGRGADVADAVSFANAADHLRTARERAGVRRQEENDAKNTENERESRDVQRLRQP